MFSRWGYVRSGKFRDADGTNGFWVIERNVSSGDRRTRFFEAWVTLPYGIDPETGDLVP